MIYLDNAATTLKKPKSVYTACMYAMKHMSTPGRGGHYYAMRAAEAAYECREKAAKLFNVKDPENVVFVFNATHGLNIAIMSVVKPGMRVVVSGYEHNSVIRPLNALGANIDIAASELFEPEVAVSVFERKLLEKPDAVIVNHVSNVFGYQMPVERISDLCAEQGIPFILDASQSAGTLNINMEKLKAAFIAMPGHKGLYGPQGTGLLLCGAKPRPLLQGGSGSNSTLPLMPDYLPDMLEAGTHNMPGIAGLSAGIDFVLKNRERILAHEKHLISVISEELRGIQGLKVFASDHVYSQVGVISFKVEGVPSEIIGERLSDCGIAVRAGLHCSPMAHKTAKTYPDGTVRVSVSAFSTEREVKILSSTVKNIVKEILC